MGFTGPKISDILLQKVQDIQSRLPIQMTLTGDLKASFSGALAEATAAAAAKQEADFSSTASSSATSASALSSSAAAAAAAAFASSSAASGAGTAFPGLDASTPTSGYASNAASFPRLDAEQIQAIMPRIDAAIAENAATTGIDQKLLRALIRQESSFQPFSVSEAGAMGLTQLMPGTASDLGITDPYRVEDNIRGGALYLKQQLETFGGDPALALAAYNAGPNAVKEHGGVPPYAETKDFVQKVLSYYNMYRAVGQ